MVLLLAISINFLYCKRIFLIVLHNFDVGCLSETFLNSFFENDGDRLKIDGYNLTRLSHRSNLWQGGICIYYKEHIPLVSGDDICTLSNCLVVEIRSNNEKCYLTCLYRSPNQKYDEFENLCVNLDVFLSNINHQHPLCSAVTGNFSARCSK